MEKRYIFKVAGKEADSGGEMQERWVLQGGGEGGGGEGKGV